MCIFSPHNIVKDAPFSRINILSCRNLLIYLSTELQNRVIPIFHFALRSEGILFLGSSENLTRHHKLFAPIDRKSRVFRRVETASRIIPDFPLTQKQRGGEMAKAPTFPAPVEGWLPASISRHAASLAERYAPAFIVVDVHGDVLHFSGAPDDTWNRAPTRRPSACRTWSTASCGWRCAPRSSARSPKAVGSRCPG